MVKFFESSVCCSECKSLRINSSPDHSVCPNGHGRLFPPLTNGVIQLAFETTLPNAERPTKRLLFTIPGHDGVWKMRGSVLRFNGSIAANQVAAIQPHAKKPRPKRFEQVPSEVAEKFYKAVKRAEKRKAKAASAVLAGGVAVDAWKSLKAECKGAMLLFRVGDFCELFHEDAQEAAKILGLTLTVRAKGDASVPMTGFPHHSMDSYLGRLVAAGRRVAVCEQVAKSKRVKATT
jgi:hypothetical protein